MRFFKPAGVTWRDWWASRTNKVVSVLLAIFLAAQNGAVSLVDLGIPESWSSFFMSAMGVGIALGLFNLRATTDGPLQGRSKK